MIIVNLDVMMARRKMSLNELSERVGITVANLSILKTGKAKAVRFSTLDAICPSSPVPPATSSSTAPTPSKTTSASALHSKQLNGLNYLKGVRTLDKKTNTRGPPLARTND